MRRPSGSNIVVPPSLININKMFPLDGDEEDSEQQPQKASDKISRRMSINISEQTGKPESSINDILADTRAQKERQENVAGYENSKLKHFPMILLKTKINNMRKQGPMKKDMTALQDKQDIELLRGCFEIDKLATSYESIDGLSVLLKRNIGLENIPAESDIAALKDIVRSCTASIAISLRSTDISKDTLVSKYFQRVSLS
jgi:hypothetical protein